MKTKVKTISHLFWGQYPYKVTLRVPVPELGKNESWHHRLEAMHKAVRDNVKGTDGVKARLEANTPSYFFMTEVEAQTFMDLNTGMVSQFFRPESSAQVAMLADEKLRYRKSLFFNKYRWAVVMKSSYMLDMTEVDEWIEDYFDLDRPLVIATPGGHCGKSSEGERAKYNYYWTRAIYVNDLADVCAIKLALGQHVKSTLCVVLPQEIEQENVPLLVQNTPVGG